MESDNNKCLHPWLRLLLARCWTAQTKARPSRMTMCSCRIHGRLSTRVQGPAKNSTSSSGTGKDFKLSLLGGASSEQGSSLLVSAWIKGSRSWLLKTSDSCSLVNRHRSWTRAWALTLSTELFNLATPRPQCDASVASTSEDHGAAMFRQTNGSNEQAHFNSRTTCGQILLWTW